MLGCGDPLAPELASVEAAVLVRKADADRVVPLCRRHHQQLHRVGIRTFQGRHQLDLDAAARRVDRTWRQEDGGR